MGISSTWYSGVFGVATYTDSARMVATNRIRDVLQYFYSIAPTHILEYTLREPAQCLHIAPDGMCARTTRDATVILEMVTLPGSLSAWSLPQREQRAWIVALCPLCRVGLPQPAMGRYRDATGQIVISARGEPGYTGPNDRAANWAYEGVWRIAEADGGYALQEFATSRGTLAQWPVPGTRISW